MPLKYSQNMGLLEGRFFCFAGDLTKVEKSFILLIKWQTDQRPHATKRFLNSGMMARAGNK
jgi:hypothetical protein